jgi:nucleotide-binding universal stress UspA family protein
MQLSSLICVMLGDGMMDPIVCAIDFSSADRAVVHWAAMIARRSGAQLWLFHAIHAPSDSLHPTTEFERGGRLRFLHEQRRSAIDRLMACVPVPYRTEMVSGEPVETLARFCRQRPVGMVVAGSRGVRGLKRLMYGTVVERMVREVSCPLLVLHANAQSSVRIERIGICCDLTYRSSQLVARGVELAKTFGAHIDLLHAMAAPPPPDPELKASAPYSQVQQIMEERVKEQLLAMLPAKVGEGVEIGVHSIRGEAMECVAEMAAELPVDLLLVGVRRHSAIGKWVVGSTTEAVLRGGFCPVLTVPLVP